MKIDDSEQFYTVHVQAQDALGLHQTRRAESPKLTEIVTTIPLCRYLCADAEDFGSEFCFHLRIGDAIEELGQRK